MSETPDAVMTLQEAAAFLRLHPRTLSRWIRSGEVAVPHGRVGERLRFRKSELCAWMAEGSD
jgi:excisionase family DNA binding protein